MENWALGVILTLIACMGTAGGFVLMKYSANIGESERLNFFCRPYWWLGGEWDFDGASRPVVGPGRPPQPP